MSAKAKLQFHSSSISGYGAPKTQLRIVGDNSMSGTDSSVIDLAAAKSQLTEQPSKPVFERIDPSRSETAPKKPSLLKKYGLFVAGGVLVLAALAGYDYYQTFHSKSAGEAIPASGKPASKPIQQPSANDVNNHELDVQPAQAASGNQLLPQGEPLDTVSSMGVNKSSELTNADMEAAQKLLNGSESENIQTESKVTAETADIRIDNIETLGRDTATQVHSILPEIKQMNDRLSKTEADSLANKRAITQLSQLVSSTTKDMDKIKSEIGATKQQIEVLDTKVENLYVLVEPLLKNQSPTSNKIKTPVSEKSNAIQQSASEPKKKIEIASTVPQELSGLKLVAVQGNKAVIKIIESGKSALIEVGQSYQNLGKVDQIQEAKILGHFDDGKLWLIK